MPTQLALARTVTAPTLGGLGAGSAVLDIFFWEDLAKKLIIFDVAIVVIIEGHEQIDGTSQAARMHSPVRTPVDLQEASRKQLHLSMF